MADGEFRIVALENETIARLHAAMRNRDPLKNWRKPAAAVGVALVLLATIVFLLSLPLETLFSSEATLSAKTDAVRQWLVDLGPLAPAAYVLFVTVEVVVAPIPGAFLYAPGGFCFGGFWGGLLSLIGNTIGAAIACASMRRLGYDRVRKMLSPEFRQYQQRLGKSGFWFVLVLRLNPLTSSDMVSYAAGLTPLPVWKLAAATALGMAPLCFAQSYLAAELFTAFPALLIPLAIGCVAYLAAVIAVVVRMRSSDVAVEP